MSSFEKHTMSRVGHKPFGMILEEKDGLIIIKSTPISKNTSSFYVPIKPGSSILRINGISTERLKMEDVTRMCMLSNTVK